nr:MAG TPA: hypothetical protein [Caudoviricetes sp.]
MKDKIVKWYKQGLWTKDMVRKAVEKKVITKKGLQRNCWGRLLRKELKNQSGY